MLCNKRKLYLPIMLVDWISMTILCVLLKTVIDLASNVSFFTPATAFHQVFIGMLIGGFVHSLLTVILIRLYKSETFFTICFSTCAVTVLLFVLSFVFIYSSEILTNPSLYDSEIIYQLVLTDLISCLKYSLLYLLPSIITAVIINCRQFILKNLSLRSTLKLS